MVAYRRSCLLLVVSGPLILLACPHSIGPIAPDAGNDTSTDLGLETPDVGPDAPTCSAVDPADAGLAGGVTRLAECGGGAVHHVVLDDTNVYWTLANWPCSPEFGCAPDPKPWVLTVPKTGGTPTVLAWGVLADMEPENGATGLALDASSLYLETLRYGLMNANKDGSSAMWLADAYTYGVVLDDTSLYWIDDNGTSILTIPKDGGTASIAVGPDLRPVDATVDETNIYWLSRAPYPDPYGQLVSTPKSGGAATVLVDRVLNPGALALDASGLYFTSGIGATGTSIMRVSTDGTGLTMLASITDPAQWTREIALDETNVYLTGTQLLRVAKSGGSPTVLLPWSLGFFPSAIAVDATTIYFASDNYPGILTLPK